MWTIVAWSARSSLSALTSASGAITLTSNRRCQVLASRSAIEGRGLAPKVLALLTTSCTVPSVAAAWTIASRWSGSVTSPAMPTTVAPGPECADGAIESFGAAGVDDERPATIDERFGQRTTESLRGSGDHRNGWGFRARAHDGGLRFVSMSLAGLNKLLLVLMPEGRVP